MLFRNESPRQRGIKSGRPGSRRAPAAGKTPGNLGKNLLQYVLYFGPPIPHKGPVDKG